MIKQNNFIKLFFYAVFCWGLVFLSGCIQHEEFSIKALKKNTLGHSDRLFIVKNNYGRGSPFNILWVQSGDNFLLRLQKQELFKDYSLQFKPGLSKALQKVANDLAKEPIISLRIRVYRDLNIPSRYRGRFLAHQQASRLLEALTAVKNKQYGQFWYTEVGEPRNFYESGCIEIFYYIG